MKRFTFALVLLGLVAAAPLPKLTADEAIAVKAAGARGRLLFQLDRAAWITTDTLVAQLPKERQSEIRGWIVSPADGQFKVTYFGLTNDQPYGVYVAFVTGKKVELALQIERGGPWKFSDAELLMARAVLIARQNAVGPWCTSVLPNTIVVPPSELGSSVSVYVLSAEEKPGEIPLGGDYRFDIDKRGDVVGSRAYTKSCLIAPKVGGPGKPEAFLTSHLLDPVPTEIHSFVSYAAGIPLFVVTNDGRVWEVNKDKIRLVGNVADSNGHLPK